MEHRRKSQQNSGTSTHEEIQVSKLNFSNEERFEKRLPATFPRRKNDVYINQKSNFIAQFNKCKSMLANEEKEIVIHGLGAAVNTAVNLALQLKSSFSESNLTLEASTSTVDLVDDMISEDGHRFQYRKNSAIHIKIKQSIATKS
ncbi:Ribonuclease P protein subunit p20, partial [Stegodyphus mimosarum]